MSLKMLIFRYSIFAVIATVANLLTQRLVLAFGTSTVLFAGAVAVGTLVGLIVKYILDKQWIFYDGSTGVKAHGEKFTLYTVMGTITTAMFWGLETTFWYIWKTDLMREIGAIIGLTIGYVFKYNLDKRFVFKSQNLRVSA
jgi:putative flippase GtrA